jgi:hypothetical protein
MELDLSLLHIIALVSFAVFVIAMVYGFVYCHGVLGPNILKRHRVRGTTENYLWFGNLMNVETELKQIVQTANDRQAINTLRAIKASKYVMAAGFVSFLFFFVVGHLNR